MDRHFLFQFDAGGLAGFNNALQLLQIPPGLVSQDRDTKFKRLVDPDAAMAEGTLGSAKQGLRRCVVQVNCMAVRERSFFRAGASCHRTPARP